MTVFVRRRGQRRRVPGTAAPVHHGQGCAARRLNGRGQVLVAAYRPAVGGDDQIAQPQPGCLGGVIADQHRVARTTPRQRSPEEQKIIDTAKHMLMEKNNMTEQEAFRYIQKCSMDSGNTMVDSATMVMSIFTDA